MTTTGSFPIGITLYCFTSEYLSFQYSFDDCMQLASLVGDRGVEIVGPQHRGWPRVSNEFERTFKSGVERYGLIPTSYSGYGDEVYNTDPNDLLEYVLLQVKGAHKLGFPMVRFGPGADPVIERALPLAEKLNIKIAYEIHVQDRIGPFNERTEAYVRHIQKLNTPFLGLYPDGGIFINKISQRHIDRAKRSGMPENIVNKTLELYNAKASEAQLIEEVKSLGGDAQMADMAVNIWRENPRSDPKAMLELMPYMRHFHGKFWTWENGCEPTIPYDEVVQVLVEGGFKEWMSIEFEGHSPSVDTFSVVKGFEGMVKGYRDKYLKA
jgi:sugar phosphate isomerase/epimerase